ncbi:hypothetical protein AMAG_11172 [Allomyces macrogynus ATCC 38327]|uniref:Uncharacterized protein n=1 Tax=Allomyces macrogynus (strain ATCC 38327) TaxID=578462 RepID=A0A0L0ST98_ALLM3|nr:hypothetical protein AMAG_11172 [Allomyces macrogynus ATCC 38327]|eukprot:KNE65559.1 hypothetical protein AMAG_11172 [Allomyces macrogynus ATCC 38327]
MAATAGRVAHRLHATHAQQHAPTRAPAHHGLTRTRRRAHLARRLGQGLLPDPAKSRQGHQRLRLWLPGPRARAAALSREVHVVVRGHLEDLATGHVHAAWGLPAAADVTTNVGCIEVTTFYTYPRSCVEHAEGPAELILPLSPARSLCASCVITRPSTTRPTATSALLHAGTVAWPAKPNSAMPVTGAGEITVLPNVRTWSTPLADQVAMDFKMRGSAVALLPSPQVLPDMPIRADFDVALLMRVHTVLARCAGAQPAATEMAATRAVINDRFTVPHIEPHWTATTHSFEANLAQFTPANAVVNHGLRLQVAPSRQALHGRRIARDRHDRAACPHRVRHPDGTRHWRAHARCSRLGSRSSRVSLPRPAAHPRGQLCRDARVTAGPGAAQPVPYAQDRRRPQEPQGPTRRSARATKLPNLETYALRPTLHHDHAVHWAAWTHRACPAGQTCGCAMVSALTAVRFTLRRLPFAAVAGSRRCAVPDSPTRLMHNAWPSSTGTAWAGVLDE